jgi:ligand-binding sensor domain-containing protein
MARMKPYLYLGLVCCLTAAPAGATTSSWTTYANTRTVHGLAVSGTTLWVATEGGLAQYSTVSHTHLATYNNTHGLASIELRMVNAEGNTVWTGGKEGCLNYSDNAGVAWQNYRLDEKTVTVSGLARWNDRVVYLATNKGIFLIIDGRLKEAYTAFAGDNNVPVNDIMVASDSLLWIATDRGVFSTVRKPNLSNPGNPNLLNPTQWIAYKSPAIPSDTVRCLARHNGAVWIGTRQGAAMYSLGTWTTQNNGWSAPRSINDLYSFGDTLWAATDSGIYRYDGSQWRSLWTSQWWITNSSINAITVDAGGQVWIGTQWAGILFFDQAQDAWEYIFLTAHEPLGNFVYSLALEGDMVWCGGRSTEGIFGYQTAQDAWTAYTGDVGDRVCRIAMDGNGNKWYASFGGGLFRINAANALAKYDTTNSPLRPTLLDPGVKNTNYVTILDVAVDGQNRAWICDWGYKLMVFNPAASDWQNYTGVLQTTLNENYMSIDIDRDGQVWISTDNGGARLWGDSVMGTFSDARELSSSTVNRIRHDLAGRTWFATNQGINMCENGSWTYTKESALLENMLVYDLDFDTLGNVWAGTSEYGVFQLSPEGDTLAHYTTSNSGLVHNKVQAVAVDRRSGAVWLGTFHGLSRFQSVFGAPPPDNTYVRVYPNPWVPTKHPAGGVTFADLLPGSSLSIFTAAGELVYRVVGSQTYGTQLTWPGTNQQGKPAASGLYYYVVTLPGQGTPARGRLAIIR